MKNQAISPRISYLDGHRGLAILLVILYHAYSRWPELVPYGHDFVHFPLFSKGWLGVNLFFLISGFVILMTLEKCKTFGEFMYRRWLRLFPTMLICSVFIFLTATLFYQRPAGLPVLRDLLPGLTFVEPSWLEQIFGPGQGIMEGAFWSLYVEFKFYVIASLLFFRFGRNVLIALLFGFFMATEIIDIINKHETVFILNWIGDFFHELGFEYFGWFAAGASFYLYVSTSERKWLSIGTTIALISSVLIQDSFVWSSAIAASAVSLFFAASILYERLQRFLESKVLLFFGFISYPLYLLHENMMISMIIQFGDYFPKSLYFALPVIPIFLVVALAYIVASFLEVPLKRMINRFIQETVVVGKELKAGTNINTEG